MSETPCPFCGGDSELDAKTRSHWCSDCGAEWRLANLDLDDVNED